MKRWGIVIFMLILGLNLVYALSINPSSIRIEFESNFEGSYTFKTDSLENLSVSITGELSDYISLENNFISQNGTFVVNVSLPETLGEGTHLGFVGLVENGGSGTVSGIASIKAPIDVRVTYQEYDVSILSNVSDVSSNQMANFSVNLANLDTRNISESNATFTILDSSNTIVKTLFTETKQVITFSNETFSALFDAAQHTPGIYNVLVNVTYGYEHQVSEKEFRIGIFGTVGNFNLGPRIGDTLSIAMNCLDEQGISSIYYANNLTGNLANVSSSNFSDTPNSGSYIINHSVVEGTILNQFSCLDVNGNSYQTNLSTNIYTSYPDDELFFDNGQIDGNGLPVYLNNNLSSHNWTYQQHFSADDCGDSATCNTNYKELSSDNQALQVDYNRNFGVSTGSRGARWYLDLADYLNSRKAFSIELDVAPSDYCKNHAPSSFAPTGGDCETDLSIELIGGSIFSDSTKSNIESQSNCKLTFDVPTCENGKQSCDNRFTPKHLYSSCTGSERVRSNETSLGNFEYDMYSESNNLHQVKGTYLDGKMTWYVDGQHFFTHNSSVEDPKTLMLKCGRDTSLDKKGFKHMQTCLFDNIRVCSGPNNCTTSDNRKPILVSSSINSTSVQENETIQISYLASDYNNITSIFFADNRSGQYENLTSASNSFSYINYSINITNNLSAASVVGNIVTFVDSSDNSIQEIILYEIASPPTVVGTVENVNTNLQNLASNINSSENLTGVQNVEFTQENKTVLEFNFNFSGDKVLDFTNITIFNASNSSNAALIVSGIDLKNTSFTKTVYMDRLNPDLTGICVRDEELESIVNITQDCSGTSEFKIECDGTDQDGYACSYNSSTNLYTISGLKHSGVIQLDYIKPSSSVEASTISSSGSSSGSGSGGSSGSGKVCNQAWECEPWGKCDGKWQIRECSLVKVKQHFSNYECPSIENSPKTSMQCTLETLHKEPEEIKVADTKIDETDGTISESEKPSKITGMATLQTDTPNKFVSILITSLTILIGSIFYYRRT
ncbi:hypothetical protein ISS07_05790 [Candidatus Woesearchaeota archaeon]|nr:hypothetical protein [Candidatus Woesearchaeota archaeon]